MLPGFSSCACSIIVVTLKSVLGKEPWNTLIKRLVVLAMHTKGVGILC